MDYIERWLSVPKNEECTEAPALIAIRNSTPQASVQIP